MTSAEPSDDDLLRRMFSGDEDAFVSLYRRRQGAVYRFALQMTGSADIAEEVTQEAFLTLIRAGERYNPARGSLAAYLCGIARNHILRCLERNRLHVAMEEDLAGAQDTLGDLTRAETIESVRLAVLALPASYREVIVLCDLNEMSYNDAAAALGCAVGTVRSRLHRGRAMLLEKLEALKRTFA